MPVQSEKSVIILKSLPRSFPRKDKQLLSLKTSVFILSRLNSPVGMWNDQDPPSTSVLTSASKGIRLKYKNTYSYALLKLLQLFALELVDLFLKPTISKYSS